MKTLYIKICLLLIASYTASGQIHDPANAPFVGTWAYQSGNQIFRLFITEDQMPNSYNGKYYLHANYQMVQTSGNFETVLYTTILEAPYDQLSAFSGGVNNGTLSGMFQEGHTGSSGIIGNLSLTPISTCNGCPAKLSYNLLRSEGVRVHEEGETYVNDFVVPTSIELTKQ